MSPEELSPVTFWAWTGVTAKDCEAPFHLSYCLGLPTLAPPTRPVWEGEENRCWPVSHPSCRSRRAGLGSPWGASCLLCLEAQPWGSSLPGSRPTASTLARVPRKAQYHPRCFRLLWLNHQGGPRLSRGQMGAGDGVAGEEAPPLPGPVAPGRRHSPPSKK